MRKSAAWPSVIFHTGPILKSWDYRVQFSPLGMGPPSKNSSPDFWHLTFCLLPVLMKMAVCAQTVFDHCVACVGLTLATTNVSFIECTLAGTEADWFLLSPEEHFHELSLALFRAYDSLEWTVAAMSYHLQLGRDKSTVVVIEFIVRQGTQHQGEPLPVQRRPTRRQLHTLAPATALGESGLTPSQQQPVGQES